MAIFLLILKYLAITLSTLILAGVAGVIFHLLKEEKHKKRFKLPTVQRFKKILRFKWLLLVLAAVVCIIAPASMALAGWITPYYCIVSYISSAVIFYLSRKNLRKICDKEDDFRKQFEPNDRYQGRAKFTKKRHVRKPRNKR